jgi:hypothetical protein
MERGRQGEFGLQQIAYGLWHLANVRFKNLDKGGSRLHTGVKWKNEQSTKDKGGKMDILWIVNTNTFLLVILIIMVSYLTAQVSALIRWLRRE